MKELSLNRNSILIRDKVFIIIINSMIITVFIISIANIVRWGYYIVYIVCIVNIVIVNITIVNNVRWGWF